MKTSVIRLLLYLSFILAAGCSSSDPSGTNIQSNVSGGNAVVFNPSTGEIPLPNVLATATAKNPLSNTLSASDAVVRSANSPMTPPEALSYINYYEVGSTSAVSGVNAPVYIRFSSPVDIASVTAANVKVFQMTTDTTSTSSPENNPLGFVDVTGMFSFKYTIGSTDLLLFPNFPLSPATRYVYFVTNRVLDAASGKPVVSSTYFELLKSKFALVGTFAALEPIRANVMSGTNIKLSGYAKVMDDLITASKVASRDEITLMGRFITTGAGFVSKDAIGTMMPVENALRSFATGGTLGAASAVTWTNDVNSTTTYSGAAYWSAAGAPGTAPASLGSVITGTINSAELSLDPVVVKANAATGINQTATVGAYNPAAGVVQAYRNSSGILTGFYHSTKAIPFIYLVPVASNGKVVMFQHGITGQKEQVLAVAETLTGAGYAVAAIDLPMHGALSPTHKLAAGDSTTAIAQKQALWGQDFMAVGAPLATRSNIQQGAFNLNRLEDTLKNGTATLATAGISTPTEIKYVGISLGSIVGAYYLAGNTVNGAFPSGSDMKGFLSVPGGRLAYLLQNSPAFSPSINAGLGSVGIASGTPTYNNFMLVTQSIVDTVDPATMTTPLQAGLASRLSGRIAIQEAVGDLVIPNDNTRYFGNALGGRGVLNTSSALAVAPGFSQLKYLDGTIPSIFMYNRTGNVVDGVITTKTADARALGVAGGTPSEGYFQFTQTGIGHGFLIDNKTPINTALAQTQMVAFLLKGAVVDPTTVGPLAKRALGVSSLTQEVLLPPVIKILGY